MNPQGRVSGKIRQIPQALPRCDGGGVPGERLRGHPRRRAHRGLSGLD
jgi:hypothetical protein